MKPTSSPLTSRQQIPAAALSNVLDPVAVLLETALAATGSILLAPFQVGQTMDVNNENQRPVVARIAKEVVELTDKTERLQTFTQMPLFNTLSKTDQSLLVAQLGAMVAYGQILVMRLDNAGVGPDEDLKALASEA